MSGGSQAEVAGEFAMSSLPDSRSSALPEGDYVVTLHVDDSRDLRILHGDLTGYPADAIVNAANSDLLPGGGLCGAIHYKGGPEIARECGRLRRVKGPVPTGRAVATTAGQLPAQYVIHAVGPVWEGGNRREAALLASCYRESMRVADDLKLRSIAFPAISTGIYRYPVAQAGALAVPAVIKALHAAQHLMLVSIVLFDRPTLDVFASVALNQAAESGIPYLTSIGTME